MTQPETTRLGNVERKVDALSTKLDTISYDVKGISDRLIGNKFTHDKGMVDELNDVQELAEKNKDKINKVIWFFSAAIVLINLFGWILKLVT